MTTADNTGAAAADAALRHKIDAGINEVIQAVTAVRQEADDALAQANEVLKQARLESERLRATTREEVAKIKEDAVADAAGAQRDVREMLEEEKAAMEKVHAFQKTKTTLNVGGHRFETSLQTLTSAPDTFLASMFSGRFELQPDAEGVYFIDRNGTHFGHILDYLRDTGSFTLSPAVTGPQRAELASELQFYGLLERVMPYHALEQIGVSLLKQACAAGTKQALQAAVAQARALVVQMGSTTPWLSEEFQDARYLITERMVSDVPVWAAENGKYFLYVDKIGDFSISGDAPAGGIDFSDEEIKIWHMTAADMEGEWAPNMLSPTKWRSDDAATLEVQYVAAQIENPENPFVAVPNMRVTAVHGLPDDDPAMAAALRQLADMNYERPRKRARSQSQE